MSASKQVHYVYGSGMVGCLYDNGPHQSATEAEAIEALCETFSDLPESVIGEMRAALTTDGIYYFSGALGIPDDLGDDGPVAYVSARSLAGADYCEVSGPFDGAPESDDGDG